MENLTIEAVQIECATCHIPFWINEKTDKRFRESKEKFYCPVGHVCVYGGKSQADILLETVKQRNERIAELCRELDECKRKKKKKNAKKS